jgi:RNA polymerase sigma-70 factor (ECF subfamily)
MYLAPNILEGCKNNDRRAQQALYKSCYGILMKVCYRYTTCRDDAVDLMNLGFLKVISNLEKYNPDFPFSVWIRRIMMNVIIDEFRKNKQYKSQVLFPEDDHLERENADFFVANEAEANLRTKDLLRMVQSLPPVTREVLNLQVLEGYTHKEIALMLNISESASKWHLVKAKSILKEQIERKERLESAHLIKVALHSALPVFLLASIIGML